MIKKLVFIFAAATIMLAGCGSTNPTNLRLDGSSGKAIVLLKVRDARIEYDLTLAKFDLSERKVTDSGFFGNPLSMIIKPEQSNGFAARTIDPGDYVFHDFRQQTAWALCFHADTLSFSARPGQVIFLGEFDPEIHLAQLTANAISSGRVVARDGERIHFFENIRPPDIVDPMARPGLLSEARLFVESEMLQVEADVVPVAYRKANFGTGSDLYGRRMCSGYGNKAGTKVED